MRVIVKVLLCLLLTLSAFAAEPKLVLQPIASGLDMPIGMANAGDSRMFIVLQRGQIVIWDGTQILPTPFLDLRPFGIISCCGEQGLLDVVFHPRYKENGFFYVTYTDRNGDWNLARYQVLASDPDLAVPGSATPILKILHPGANNHYSGNLVFGPDGYLYIGVGDGGGVGDQNNNAQSLGRLLGKILRLDVDSAAPYSIPPDNPFVGRGGAMEEIWAYGLRNPWRFTFDRETGDLFIGDVGQANFEEVDFEPASSIGGVNYGWRNMEGFHCFNPQQNCQSSNSLTLPILEYNHTANDCSITGGYRYRGTRSENMRGIYFYGDYCTGRLWGASQNEDGDWSTKLYLTSGAKITSFGQDAAGELYLTDHRGTVFRLVDESAPIPTPKKRRAAAR